MKHPQFTFDLDRPADYSPSAFARAPANEAAMRLVEQWPDWAAPVVCIAGPASSGKSHLGEIWRERANARAIDLADLCAVDIEGGLSRPLWVDRRAGDVFAEDVLFHALNLAREEQGSILLTAREAPAKWNVSLPDLASRLKAVPVVSIEEPDDALVEAILIKRFTDMGIDAEQPVISYLLARMERSYSAVDAVVKGFGRSTLAVQRRASIPLAAEVLEGIGNPD